MQITQQEMKMKGYVSSFTPNTLVNYADTSMHSECGCQSSLSDTKSIQFISMVVDILKQSYTFLK